MPPEIAPLRERLCLLRCRLSYAQQRIRELEALLTLHQIAIPATVTVMPPVSHDCFRPAGHVIYCQGCRQAWEQSERIGLLDFAPAGDCACTCADDRDPLFEAWIVDPWVCYCGEIGPLVPESFPHRDCDGGRPLAVTDGRMGG